MEKYIENKLSIIIPTYNEAENIVKLLKEIIAVLDNKNLKKNLFFLKVFIS